MTIVSERFTHHWIVKCAIFACLFYLSEAIFPLWISGGSVSFEQSGPGNPIWYKLYLAATVASMLLLIAIHSERIIPLLQSQVLLLAVLAYMWISIVWSLDPMASLAFALKCSLAILFGMFLVTYFSPKEILSLFSIMFGIIIVTSLFFCIYLPDLGLHDTDGSWRGAYGDRNYFTMMLNIAIATLFVRLRYTNRYRSLIIGLLIIAAIMIVFSRSATGLLTLLALIGSYLAIPMIRANWPLLIMLSSTGVIFLILAFILTGEQPSFDRFFYILGKSGDFSGRLDIWQGFLSATHNHLLLGYGGQNIYFSSRGQVFTELFYSDVSNNAAPHNLYIAILLKFGLVGLFLFTMLYLQILYRAVKAIQLGVSEMRYWYLFYMIIGTIFGITLTIDYKVFLWVMFSIAISGPLVWNDNNNAKSKT